MSQIKTKFIEASAVTTAKIANSAVDENKLNTSVAGDGLTGGGGSALAVGAGSGISVTANAVAVDATVVRTNGANAFTADQSMGGFKLTNLASPVSGTDAANKNYVDAAINGLDWKQSVRAATTVAGTLASSFENGDVIDGVTLATGDRILVKNQVAGEDNGLYTVNASGAPTRATDADTSGEVTAGLAVFVEEGTTNADSGWVLTTDNPITLGTTALVFAQFTGTGSITAGTGLTKTGNTIDFNTADTSLTVNADNAAVNLNTTGGLETSSGVRIKSDTTTANTIGITTTSNGAGIKFDSNSFTDSGSETLALAAGVAGNGLALTTGVLSVNVDGSTLEINTDTLRVKDAGITLAKLASDSVDENKIVSTSFSTTGALNGGSGTKVSVRVDAVTVKINGSNNLESLKEREQSITLNGTDITNQYVDLSFAIYGTSASLNSAQLSVVGGPIQQKTVDYTVSLTGGSGGVTRLTFAGDLATGGNAALVSGDILMVYYSYLT